MLRWLKDRISRRRHSPEQKAAMAERLNQSRLMKDELVRKAGQHGKVIRP